MLDRNTAPFPNPTESAVSGPKSRKAKRCWGWKAKLCLACFSVVLTLITVEVAYRCKLYFTLGHLPLGMAATYTLYNERTTIPNSQLGYDVLPNRSVVGVRITDGQPVLMYERTTNEWGNFEPSKPHFAEADLKILVFGDSFTAYFGDGTVWPSLLEDRLQKRLERRVCVLNFGRDGYGVLDMLDLAQARISEFAPDMVLICFISDDLDRVRHFDQGRERDVPASFYDPAVTREWCEAVLAGKPDDPLLRKYNQQFAQAKANAKPINYFTPRYSFLYNRLWHEDPFCHLPSKTATHRLEIENFREDPRCVAAVEAIQARNIPTLLVRLPEMAELTAGKYLLTSRQQRLLNSLQELSGWEVLDLLPASEVEEVESLFLHPHDLHPSAKGLRFYAEKVDRALLSQELP